MRHIALLGAAVLAVTLSGCALIGIDDTTAPAPAESTAPPVAEVDKVLEVLAPLTGDSETVPTTQQFFDTMIGAGYQPDQLEATLDASPLGNEVPSKMFGVKTENGCVVGEIRSGKATAELMPPSESTGACLFGDVDRPEGVAAPEGELRDSDGASNGAGHLPGENINGDDPVTPTPTDTSDPSGSSSASGGSSADPNGTSGTGSSDGSADADSPSLGGG